MPSTDRPAAPTAVGTAAPRAANDGFFTGIRQSCDSVRMTVFVVGGMLVVFACARNTVTWYLQRFWGASGDYWQSQWENIYDHWFRGDEDSLSTAGTQAVTVGVFVLGNSFFTLMDFTGRPQFLFKYKMQEGKNEPLDHAKFRKALFWVAFNVICISLPFNYCIMKVMKKRGCSFGRELPTFHWTLFELMMFSLVEEFGFYYSHRLLHHPALYKHIHKMHHEWTAPVSIISIYCHPLEHIVANITPAMLGPLLMGSHLATTWLWLSIVLLTTTNSHCGYHFPFMPSPEAHDFHHLKFNNCYGVLGVLDRLHNTDEAFRKTKNYQRHFTFLSLTPLIRAIPDSTACQAGSKAFETHQD